MIREENAMKSDRLREIGTMGGCGEIARALYHRLGGIPCLRYDSEGRATHAALLSEGRYLHLGDSDDDLQPVTPEELDRACKEDFVPDRVNLRDDELSEIVESILDDFDE
jgi:hypothetical protein